MHTYIIVDNSKIQIAGYCRLDLTVNGDELTTVPVPFKVDAGGMPTQFAKVAKLLVIA